MSKRANTTSISTSNSVQNVLNDNYDAINTALDNTLSRDGSSPNNMTADIDMNSNDLLNVKQIDTTSLQVAGVTIVPNDSVSIPNWKGAWTTSTAYVVNDMAQESGNTYICLVAHTSGTFSADLSSSYWELFTAKGATGAGTGDLLAANNLNDLSSAVTSRTNLGVAIGSDVQKQTIFGPTNLTGGTSSAFTVSYPTNPTSYVAGQLFLMRFHTSTSSAATINVAGLGPKTIKYYRQDGSYQDVPSGGIQPNSVCILEYSGTDMIAISGLQGIVDILSGRVKLFNDTTLALDTDAHGVTQHAVKTYVDTYTANTATWQVVTRVGDTSYQNTTGGPIQVSIRGKATTGSTPTFQVSTDNVSWVSVCPLTSSTTTNENITGVTVNNGHYYRVNNSPSIATWTELR